MSLILSDEMQFAYSQFNVYDVSNLVGFLWEDVHTQQGFARSESSVSFSTVRQFGTAKVNIFHAEFKSQKEYQLAISVPFDVVSGKVAIEGPEEILIVDRKVELIPGHYRLVVAQSTTENDDIIQIDIFFTIAKDSVSKILINQGVLAPPLHLKETAERPVF